MGFNLLCQQCHTYLIDAVYARVVRFLLRVVGPYKMANANSKA
jgi:hypothetical protein